MAKPHDVLGVPPDASLSAVRAAYKKLAMQHHPDRAGGDAVRFREVQTAYDALRTKLEAQGPFDDIISDIARRSRE